MASGDRARGAGAVRADGGDGGQITGEHGVGYVQKNYLGIAYPPNYIIELLRSVKKIFDPLGILNPGKVLSDA